MGLENNKFFTIRRKILDLLDPYLENVINDLKPDEYEHFINHMCISNSNALRHWKHIKTEPIK